MDSHGSDTATREGHALASTCPTRALAADRRFAALIAGAGTHLVVATSPNQSDSPCSASLTVSWFSATAPSLLFLLLVSVGWA